MALVIVGLPIGPEIHTERKNQCGQDNPTVFDLYYTTCNIFCLAKDLL